MHFNWIMDGVDDNDQERLRIDLEYRLRPGITRYLMDRVDDLCKGDYSRFYFDVDLTNHRVTLNDRTPKKYRDRLGDDVHWKIA